MRIDEAIKSVIEAYQFYKGRRDVYTAKEYTEEEAIIIALYETAILVKDAGEGDKVDEEVKD